MRPRNKGTNRIRLTARKAVIAMTVLVLLVVWANFRIVGTMAPGKSNSNSNNDNKPMDPVELAKLMASRPEVTSPSGGAAACLLVMDDNHFLIEWLAYHYHTLPLRYLVIAVDPRSKTNPNEVLNRWKGVPNNNLTIVTWYQDSDYVTNHEMEEAKAQARDYFGDEHSDELIHHRARQRMFYFKCMQHLKQQGRHWTALIDTDEYLTLSYDTLRNYGREDVPGINQPGSVLKFLNKELQRPDAYANITSPCIQIPRLRFGTKESREEDVEAGVPAGFTGSSFQTLRWRKHVGENNFAANKISKTLIDLQRVSWDELQPVDSIHRPLRSLCGHRKLHIRKSQQALVIHHHIGTWEQYSFREDARQEKNGRSKEVSRKRGNMSTGTSFAILTVATTLVDNRNTRERHVLECSMMTE
eukprot:scaffold1834_cov175-Amphora_coffeaeformis.AAC.4